MPPLRNRLIYLSPTSIELAWDVRGPDLEVGLAGEICSFSCSLVRPALLGLITTTRPLRTLLDLSEVTFIDARGISLLLTVAEHAGDLGSTSEVARHGPVVDRLFAMCGLDASSVAGRGRSDARRGNREPGLAERTANRASRG